MISEYLSISDGTPLYARLYEGIRRDILRGELPGGQKLPSKRQLAEQLGISKTTVETAYAQLQAEGYLTAKERSGYFVAFMPLAAQPVLPASEPLCEKRPAASPVSAPQSLFPFSVWAKLMRGVLLDEGAELLRAVPSGGLYELRQAIAQELRRSRGMRVKPEQILVGAGAEYFYNLIIQFFGTDCRYAVEALGHQKIARIYRANGVEPIPVALDGGGVRMESLLASGASVLHISPSHQYPTGVVMPIGRRQAVLAWLQESPDRYVIEDDYDAEFRFSGRPIPAMQSMDADGQVLYLNTFSGTIAPALRISYLILPERLLDAWEKKLGFYACTVPSFEQQTLTRFLGGGYFERHLNRMKKYYRTVRQALLDVLAQPPVSAFCSVLGADAGLHFVLRLNTPFTDEQLLCKLREAGLTAPLLRSFYVSEPQPEANGCIVVNYTDLEPEAFRSTMLRFAEQLTDDPNAL